MACSGQDTCSSILRRKQYSLPRPLKSAFHQVETFPSHRGEPKTPPHPAAAKALNGAGPTLAGPAARAEQVTRRGEGGARSYLAKRGWGGAGRAAGAGPGCDLELRLVRAAPVSMCRAAEAQHSSPGAGPARAWRKQPRRSCGAWGRWRRRSRPRLRRRRLWGRRRLPIRGQCSVRALPRPHGGGSGRGLRLWAATRAE